MTSTHEGTLPFPTNIPSSAAAAHILPDLHTPPLISVGQLCNAGLKVIFDITKVKVIDSNDQPVLEGNRSLESGLWHLPLPKQANAALGTPTAADQVAYSHAALYSPALSTLMQALQWGFLINFPGLTAQISSPIHRDAQRAHGPRTQSKRKESKAKCGQRG